MFRFTIRELVLLTLVVAMGVGWWLDRNTLAESQRDARTREALTKVAAQMELESAGSLFRQGQN